MWTRVQDSSELYISFNPSSAYNIDLTDFVTIWTKTFTKESFLQCLQDSNSGLEIQNEQLILNCIKMLTNPVKLKRFDTILKADGKLQVNMTMLFGYPFNFNFMLEIGTKEYFFNKVTQPLLRTIEDLNSSQSKLIKLLKKKDSEIEEYKCEGGEIALRHLRTVMFNVLEHESTHTQLQGTFGPAGVSSHLLEKVVTIPEEITFKPEPEVINPKTDIKMESEMKTKIEPVSLSSQSLIAASTTAISDIKQEVKTENQYTPKKKKKKLNF